MNSKVKKELDSQPKYKAAYFRAVEKHVARRRRTGMECGGGWGTAEEYFEWWLKGRHSDVGQKELIGDET
jgi:predicted Rossmann-fold nucleotide-binding protein